MDNWFIEHLEKHRWETIEKQEPNVRWVKGIWKISSVWSPRDREVYLVFEVDPQDDPENIGHTLWVRAFIDPPTNWILGKNGGSAGRQARCFATSVLRRNREKYINEFFEELNKLRLNQD